MQPIFLGDNVAFKTEQAGDSVVVMGRNDTVISAGGDTIFGGTGHSTIYDTGIAPTQTGYRGDTVVLGNDPASVLIGGIGSTVFGGAGQGDIFYASAPGTLVAGKGDLNIVGNPNGVGIFFGGGVTSLTYDQGGAIVHTGLGATDRLWAAGPLS